MGCSVAVATYNGEKYINQLLDSLRNQTFPPDEVIIIDDCSKDNTYEYTLFYIKKHMLTNWKVIQNEKNLGWKKNFRNIISKCNENLIFLCDQDDIWSETKIEEMYKIMDANPDINLLASNYTPIYIGKQKKIRTWNISKNNGKIVRLTFKDTHLDVLRPGCTYCVRRQFAKEVFKNDIELSAHDGMLWRYAALNNSLAIFQKRLIKYVRHGDNATSPTINSGRENKIKEIEWQIYLCKRFIETSNTIVLEQNFIYLYEQLNFLKDRLQIVINKNIFASIRFIMLNTKKYSTKRNMISDILTIIH